MIRRVAILLFAGTAGCGGPSIAPCDFACTGGVCPPGLVCMDGVCQAPGGGCGADAPDGDGTPPDDARPVDAPIDALVGVLCAGTTVCASYCCVSGDGAACDTACGGTFFYCDGPEDCATPLACCLDAYNLYSTCIEASSCAGPPQYFVMCHASADCPSLSAVCGTDSSGYFQTCQ